MKCFFCREAPGSADGLHDAATFQLDSHVRSCAMILSNMDLLTKLNAGDMVAQDAKYHQNCLMNLYNRLWKIKEMSGKSSNDEQATEGLSFAQLVVFIEEALSDGEMAPVFKLANLAQLYASRMEQMLGVKYDCRVHTTVTVCTLSQRVHSIRSMMSCLHLMKTSAMTRQRLVNWIQTLMLSIWRMLPKLRDATSSEMTRCSTDFLQDVNRTLYHPCCLRSWKDTKRHSESTTPAALSIAQLLKFNSLKH